MLFSVPPKFLVNVRPNNFLKTIRKCYNVFGIKELIKPEKLDNYNIVQVAKEQHEAALEMVKQLYLPNHLLVRERNMNISNDCAFDEYILGLLKQGNSLFAKAEDDTLAGLVVNYASSTLDPKNLWNYALYRQDPNTKDFLSFTAKIQALPNLWNVFKEPKIFEIKMVTVAPEFRRQGLAVLLTERSKELAQDQGYKVVRLDCMGPHDYKIAERCMMNCIAKFPLHKVRGPNAPYIKLMSDNNVLVRVYVTTQENNLDDLNIDLGD